MRDTAPAKKEPKDLEGALGLNYRQTERFASYPLRIGSLEKWKFTTGKNANPLKKSLSKFYFFESKKRAQTASDLGAQGLLL